MGWLTIKIIMSKEQAQLGVAYKETQLLDLRGNTEQEVYNQWVDFIANMQMIGVTARNEELRYVISISDYLEATVYMKDYTELAGEFKRAGFELIYLSNE